MTSYWIMGQNYTPIDDLIQQGSPVSALPQKEVEPVSTKPSEETVLHEVSEHKMSEEVASYIKQRDETVNVPPDLSSLGVAPVGTPNYVALNPKKLPLSDDSIMKNLHASVKSSIRWLAESCLYILRQTHVTLKKVHGKIVRVAT